jgi:PAP2 superfamily
MMIWCVSRRLLPAGGTVGLVLLLAAVSSAGATSGFEFPNVAQTDQGAASPSAPSLPSGGGPVPAADRQVSWKLMTPNVLSDQKSIWLFPAQLGRGRHWKPAAGFAAETAALVALDPHVASYFRGARAFAGFNSIISGRNATALMTAVPLSFYAIGVAGHDKYAQNTALLVGEAVVDSEMMTQVVKSVDRRLRPADVPPPRGFSDTFFEGKSGGFLSGKGSFPSGHEIAAFSVATVFARRYRRHRWVPWVAYGLAVAIGFSRVSLQSHFASDVFAGAVLGYSISNYVVLRR